MLQKDTKSRQQIHKSGEEFMCTSCTQTWQHGVLGILWWRHHIAQAQWFEWKQFLFTGEFSMCVCMSYRLPTHAISACSSN